MNPGFMALAIAEAEKAGKEGEVPVGAVIVRKDMVVARGRNDRERSWDPSGHAELMALRRASLALGRWRLSDCTLYVTLEPCPMCAGALLAARVERVVFGARDPKAGALVSLYTLGEDPRLNHRFEVVPDLEADRCAALLREFFRVRRR
ncbi:MAG: tRNA adenosine(34) deaminase TadA [Myxococcota bacterium]